MSISRCSSAKVPYTRGLPGQLASSLIWNGQVGVQIFFAVSGFLITATTLRRWGALPAVVVLALFRVFVEAGKPLHAVPLLFLSEIVVAGQLAELAGRFYAEPLNRRLRRVAVS